MRRPTAALRRCVARLTALARLVAPVAVLAVIALGAVSATAFWVAGGIGSGAGAVGTVSAPSVSAASPVLSNPVVTWTASTVTPSSPALNAQVTYVVERSSNGGSSWGAAGGTCAAVISAPTTNCTDSLSAAGTYLYRVTARFRTWTAVGVSGSVTVVTLTAPTITSAPPNPSANTSPSFAFTGGGGTGYECRLDAGPWSACPSPRVYASLSSASHTFGVRATQSALFGPETSYTWTIDTAAPTLTASPTNPTASTSATFSFTHASYPGSFQCKLDAAAFAACNSGTVAYTGLALGSHTFTVRSLDSVSVATSDRVYTWTIANPPVVTITSCNTGVGKRNFIIGTTTQATGTLTVRVYQGVGIGGALAQTITTTNFTGAASPSAWTLDTLNNTLTTGATYTAQATHVTAGGTSNQPTCTFVSF